MAMAPSCGARNTSAMEVMAIDKAWFQARLKALGKSQAGLARAMSIEPPQITRMLNGQRQIFGQDIPVIAAYLEMAPADLLSVLTEPAAVRPAPPPGPRPDGTRDVGRVFKGRDHNIVNTETTQVREYPSIRPEVQALHSGPKTLPVFGSGVCGTEGWTEMNGTINEYIHMPYNLAGVANAYGLYVFGTSMEPQFREGQIIHVHPHRPVRIGDPVIVQTADHAGLIKVLEKRDSRAWTFRQHKPNRAIEIPAANVLSVHRIVGWSDPDA